MRCLRIRPISEQLVLIRASFVQSYHIHTSSVERSLNVWEDSESRHFGRKFCKEKNLRFRDALFKKPAKCEADLRTDGSVQTSSPSPPLDRAAPAAGYRSRISRNGEFGKYSENKVHRTP
ncbi:hypothetical protein EVAR_74409_1 [Eumeta japonica]|uniref:Uncharacterized protein n=1 Tax=Eumeta variegata TaxID=151549 RepID=A0A4C1SD78_EUMVA|nr:hypothetical protein EVAR_74409_1 [Eumeta japonica]